MKEMRAAKAKRIGGDTADLFPPRAEKKPRQQAGRKAGTKDSSERKASSAEQEGGASGESPVGKKDMVETSGESPVGRTHLRRILGMADPVQQNHDTSVYERI
jgi:hypothetical protein